jgi:hypothetical protein
MTFCKIFRLYYLLILYFLPVLFVACSDRSSHATSQEMTQEPPAVKMTPVEKFDLLEKIFANSNWLVVDGKDSSYFYCSRLGKTNCKVYGYTIAGGDSTQTIVTEIKAAGDSIIAEWPQHPLASYLTMVDTVQALWKDKNDSVYIFRKVDDRGLQVKYPGKANLYIEKTITISSFLVRSKYDYKHGTRLAFENAR